MPTSAEAGGARAFAVDTSVAIAALDGGHAAHEASRRRVLETRAALAGHAVFETYSVLTRTPGALRLAPPTATAVLESAFPERCWLGRAEADELMRQCGAIGIAGGAIYDALVGQAALTNGRTLLTRDRRAQRTYDLLGVFYELLS